VDRDPTRDAIHLGAKPPPQCWFIIAAIWSAKETRTGFP